MFLWTHLVPVRTGQRFVPRVWDGNAIQPLVEMSFQNDLDFLSLLSTSHVGFNTSERRNTRSSNKKEFAPKMEKEVVTTTANQKKIRGGLEIHGWFWRGTTRRYKPPT